MVHIPTDSFILVSRPILGIKTNSPLNYLGCAEMASPNWLPPNGMPFSLEILLSKDEKIRLDILDNTFVVGQRILVASTKKRKKGLLF
jgi:hypothetical protein